MVGPECWIDFFDPQQLVDTLAKIYADPNAYNAVRITVRATVVDRYDLQKVRCPSRLHCWTGSLNAPEVPAGKAPVASPVQ